MFSKLSRKFFTYSDELKTLSDRSASQPSQPLEEKDKNDARSVYLKIKKQQEYLKNIWTVCMLSLMIYVWLAVVTTLVLRDRFWKHSCHDHYNKTKIASPINCGTSIAEAKARGCHFDVMRYSWIPPQCYDFELTEEFLEQPWNWYANQNRSGVISEDIIRQGQQNHVWVTWEYQLAMCDYSIRKLHMAFLVGEPVETSLRRYESTDACLRMLSMRDVKMKEIATMLAIGFSTCEPPIAP